MAIQRVIGSSPFTSFRSETGTRQVAAAGSAMISEATVVVPPVTSGTATQVFVAT